ncbi:hypothetical protein BDY21DRAFT_329706 [Lineolata rhizophorae]|uniref:Uncharacterized protein n=1 Tax=Lineolata rhizophorae TaxID=578093 RepID=A0A6A6PCX4_9PEZI|nr:hypothetical protein BDY21DRAFT_329706 [Lineolata rhizophorae]
MQNGGIVGGGDGDGEEALAPGVKREGKKRIESEHVEGDEVATDQGPSEAAAQNGEAQQTNLNLNGEGSDGPAEDNLIDI